MMDVLKIIFWVCIVEASIGHLSWWAPLICFIVACFVTMPDTNKKLKAQKELEEILEKIKKLEEILEKGSDED